MLIFFRKKKKEAPVLRVKIKGYEPTTLASWYHRLPYQILRIGDASAEYETLVPMLKSRQNYINL